MKTGSCPFSLPLLLLLLGVAAWPLSVPAPWGAWVLPATTVLALAAGLACRRIPARMWIAAALLLGLIAVYAWNPMYQWVDGRGLVPQEYVSWLPATAFSGGTWKSLQWVAAMVAAFLLSFQLSRWQIRGLQGAGVLAAVAMALAVLMQRLEPNRWSIYEYTGIFVNENHFAVFSNLLLPVVLALAARARFRAVRDGRPSSPAGLYLLAAVLMAAAVVLCRSRAGVAVMALLVGAHLGLCRRTLRQYPFVGMPHSRGTKALGWLSVLAATGFAVAAFWREWRHLGVIGREWAYRLGILRDALAAWREHPVWGLGPGTFSAVHPYYQSALYEGRSILHAHCEPVQFLFEYGVAGGLLVVGSVLVMLGARGGAAAAKQEIPPFSDLERPAFVFALAGFGLHALVDFPLRIPLIALIVAAWAGVWAGTRGSRPAAGGVAS
jgi:O-antigen ligase